MKKILWSLVVIAVILVLIFSRNSSPASKLIVVNIAPFSGPASFFGEQFKKGMDLANVDGKLDLVHEDSKSMPADGVSAFQKSIATRRPDIVVSSLSAVSNAIMPTAIQNKIPVLQTLSSASKIAAQSFYALRYFTSGEQESPIIAKALMDHAGAKKFGVIYINDEYGLSYFNALKESVERAGGQIVAHEPILRTDTDFRSKIVKLNAAQPDVIYIVALDTGLVTIIKQARELNTKALLAANWIMANPSVRQQVEGMTEGMYLTAPSYYLYPDTETVQEFKKAYRTMHGSEPSAYAAIGYDVVNLLARIPASARDTSDDLVNAFISLKTVKGVMGDLAIDAEGEITFGLYPVVFKDNTMVEIK